MRFRIKKTTEKSGSINYTPQYSIGFIWFPVRVWYDEVANKIDPANSCSYIGYNTTETTQEAAQIIINHYIEINKGNRTTEIITLND